MSFGLGLGTNFQQLTLNIFLPFCTTDLCEVVLLACMIIESKY